VVLVLERRGTGYTWCVCSTAHRGFLAGCFLTKMASLGSREQAQSVTFGALANLKWLAMDAIHHLIVCIIIFVLFIFVEVSFAVFIRLSFSPLRE